jgi:hypothetical protein
MQTFVKNLNLSFLNFKIIDGSAAISTAISKHLMMTISGETCSATVM